MGLTGLRQLSNTLAAVLLGLLCGCAINPVTGHSELMLLSEQDELRLGRQTEQAIVEEYGAYDNPALQSYVQGVARPLASVSHRPALPWQFRVMDSPAVNAFAAPGGYVFVTRGLLAAVNDEAELAGVLAHEIGHVTARHSARNYSQSLLANIGLQLGTALAGSYGDVLGPLLEAGTGLLFLKYSRDDERQADALGVEYASRAGYDTNRMADFFTTLQRQETLQGAGQGGLPEWFSTHPSPADREVAVRSQTMQWRSRLPGQSFRVSRDAYLDRIDGLVYGDDPRQGFREGEWFYFPRHQVQFRIPEQWSCEQQGSQVRMGHPRQAGAILFAVQQGSAEQAARAFVSTLQARVEQSRERLVNGFRAKEMVSVISDGRQRLRVTSHFFERGQDVFIFHGLTVEQDFPRLAATLTQSADSFSPLTDQARLNRQPRRIAVKRVPKTETLEQSLRRWQVEAKLWPLIAWLNELVPGQQVAAGQRLKIIE